MPVMSAGRSRAQPRPVALPVTLNMLAIVGWRVCREHQSSETVLVRVETALHQGLPQARLAMGLVLVVFVFCLDVMRSCMAAGAVTVAGGPGCEICVEHCCMRTNYCARFLS